MPLCISIGNIKKDPCRAASQQAWILVACLPIPPKRTEKGEIHDTWHCAFQRVLEPLRVLDLQAGLPVDCSCSQQRACYPILAASIAGYQEHLILVHIKYGSCPMCELAPGHLGHELEDAESRVVYGEAQNIHKYREFTHCTDGLGN